MNAKNIYMRQAWHDWAKTSLTKPVEDKEKLEVDGREDEGEVNVYL